MPARRIDKVVTIDAMDRVAKLVNTSMGQLLRELPQAADQAESERRMAVIQETVRLMTRAALVCLKEFRPEHFRSIVCASVKYGRDRLRDRPARFIVRPQPKSELPVRRQLFLPLGKNS